jgi:hypothetical protein
LLLYNADRAEIGQASFSVSWCSHALSRKTCDLFLDGCHEYAECKADIEIWTMLIRPGGILAGHDYWPNHWGVMEAVQETGTFEVVPDTRIWFRHLPAATP